MCLKILANIDSLNSMELERRYRKEFLFSDDNTFHRKLAAIEQGAMNKSKV